MSFASHVPTHGDTVVSTTRGGFTWRNLATYVTWIRAASCLAVLAGIAFLWWRAGNNLQPIQTVSLDQDYRVMAFSANGDHLALGSGLADNLDHSNITLLDTKSLLPVWTSVRVPYELTHLQFVSEDFGFLAGVWANPLLFKGNPDASKASLVQVRYDTTFDVLIDQIPGPLTSLAVSPDHQLVAVCSEAQGNKEDASCRVYRLSDHKLLWTWSPDFCQGLSVAFTNDSEHCLLATQVTHRLAHAKNVPDPEDSGMRIFLVSANDGKLLHRQRHNDESAVYNPSLVASPTESEAYVLFHREIRRITIETDGFVSKTLLSTDGLNALHAYPYQIAFSPKCDFLPFASFGDQREGHNASMWFVNAATGIVSNTQVSRFNICDFSISPDGRTLYVLHGNDSATASEISTYNMQNL